MYCFDLKGILYVGQITIWFMLALVFLLDKKLYERGGKRIHYMALAFLLVFCLLALIAGGFAERLYAILTLCGMTAIEFMIRRRRNLASQGKDVV